jgi:hypothetical protein
MQANAGTLTRTESSCCGVKPSIYQARPVPGGFKVLVHDSKKKSHERTVGIVSVRATSPSTPHINASNAFAPVAVQPSEASQATLDVSSTPSGAEIELNGSFVGNMPSTLGVSPGGHTIKVTKNGYATWERKLNTTTGTVRLSPELDPSAPASGK